VPSTPPSLSHRFFERTFHLLIEADNSHATDRACGVSKSGCRGWDILLLAEK
jgi:hypothetical protein